MNKRAKQANQPQNQVTSHPETQRSAGGKVPDDKSSKTSSTTQHDARSGSDKDANEQQSKPAGERG
jgi:hypothetical protein